jgi:hypothetical protein
MRLESEIQLPGRTVAHFSEIDKSSRPSRQKYSGVKRTCEPLERIRRISRSNGGLLGDRASLGWEARSYAAVVALDDVSSNLLDPRRNSTNSAQQSEQRSSSSSRVFDSSPASSVMIECLSLLSESRGRLSARTTIAFFIGVAFVSFRPADHDHNSRTRWLKSNIFDPCGARIEIASMWSCRLRTTARPDKIAA